MQKHARSIVVLMAIVMFVGYVPPASAQSSTFQLESSVLQDGGTFKMEQVGSGFGCIGGGISPDLSWKSAPDGTKSFGVTMYDKDAPTGSGLWHWVIFNIPATATSLAANAGDPTKNLAPVGSIQSLNDTGTNGFVGACPTQGDKPHHYLITVYALKTDKLPLDQTASGALVGFYFNANLLAKTTLTLRYGRPSTFQLSSPVVDNYGTFKMEQVGSGFGCTGGGISPELSWKGAPDGTKSFGLNMYDEDAPTGSGLWHWVIFNIPATVTSLTANAGDPTKNLAPAGSIQARNDTGTNGFVGACPTQGDKPHHYLITVYALKTDKLPLDQTASGALVGFYFNANTLGLATLSVSYGR